MWFPCPEERETQTRGHQHLGQRVVSTLDMGKGRPLPLSPSLLGINTLAASLVRGPHVTGLGFKSLSLREITGYMRRLIVKLE